MSKLAHEIPTVESFFLQPDVYAVIGKDAATFLSLPENKYIGMDTSQACALSLVVEGWPFMRGASEFSVDDATKFAESLAARGLLTRDPSRGRPVVPLLLAHPEDALVYRHERAKPKIRLHHVRAFVVSLVQGFYWWKFRHLNHAIRHVRKKDPLEVIPTDLVDINELRDLVRAFYWIRPWFYEKYRTDPEKQAGLCLFDSLVMLGFLAKYHFHPRLVFGVQLRPYAAHSWLQEGRWILNGSPETVSAYDIIMVTRRGEV